MMPRKQDRNQEIVRRHAAGERTTDIAADYGLHITRISQIVRQEKARASVPPKPVPTEGLSGALEREQAVQAMVRPRIRKAASGLWECTDGIVTRAAHTQMGAYQRWLTAALLEEERRLMPAVAPEPAPVAPAPPRGAAVAEKPMPEAVAPPARSTPPAKPAPYVGPVTVVKGTREVTPLNLSATCPAMARNIERAKADQPPLTTMGGWSKKRNEE